MKEDSKETVIEAAGGIIWRDTDNGKKLALIHRPEYDDWTFPKGKLDPGESWQAAALREVHEETGCEAQLDQFAGSISYLVQGVPKIVLYWHMEAKHIPPFSVNQEVDEVIWLNREEALKKLDYRLERELLLRAP